MGRRGGLTSPKMGYVEFLQLLIPYFRPISGFAAVAFRHPDRLDALAIGEPQQVADGAVHRFELFLDGWQPGRESFGCQLLSKCERQIRKAVKLRPPLPVQAVQQLSRPVGGLGEAFYNLSKLLKTKAQ